jgi:uridylate kinase
MLGTIINAVVLQGALEHKGVAAEVMSALAVHPVAKPFDRHEADRMLREGAVLIVAAGVGQPYFTTDSGAALRAVELDCDALLKATKVDGVYDADPAKHPDATRFDRLPIREALERRLGVMDFAALTMCEEHGIDIAVCNFDTPGNLTRFLRGEDIGTILEASHRAGEPARA